MENELCRLSSFRDFPDSRQSGISIVTLVRKGFYYCKERNTIPCHKCNVELNQWTSNDDVIDRHRKESPRCPLVIEMNDTTNYLGSESVQNHCDTYSASSRTQTPRNDYRQPDNIYAFPPPNNLSTLNSRFQIDRSTPDFAKMRDETERLATFYDWPQDANAHPHELAKEGLFYTGSLDRVQCVFCRGYMASWEPADIPSDEHRKHFPNCPFVQGREVGNIRKTTEMSSRSNSGQIASGSRTLQSESTLPPLRADRIQRSVEQPQHLLEFSHGFDPPKHPNYSDISRRINSFKNGIVSPGQTPLRLAEAGFFHTGPGDKVQCFHCGGNLKDWAPKDDPWTEHEKWYPNCLHLRTRRMTTEAGPFHVEPREIKARVDTAAVRVIMNMGFDRDLVKTAIENRLRTNGDDFPNTATLLDAIFALQDGATAQVSASSVPRHSATAAVPMETSRSEDKDREQTNICASQRLDNANTSSSGSAAASESTLPSSDAHVPSTSQASSSSTASSAAISELSVPAAATAMSSASVAGSAGSEIVAENQSKAKGKRKKKKRKNATQRTGEKQEQTRTLNTEGNETRSREGDLNLEEFMDEESLEYAAENRRLREARTCKVCMDAEVDTVFLPCGHLVACKNCAPLMRDCPICRTFIRGTVKTYLS